MDVLLPLANKRDYSDLRYSLRSLKNIKHDRLFIVGSKPSFITNDIFVHNKQKLKYKSLNVRSNLNKCIDETDISDDFILWNDDYFAIKKIKSIEPYHQGRLYRFIERPRKSYANYYLRGMINSFELLNYLGIKEPKNFELHIPMIINRHKDLEIRDIKSQLFSADEPIHTRTVYGNLFYPNAKKSIDVKIYDENDDITLNKDYLSSSDKSFKMIQPVLEELFSERGYYECS